MGGTAGPIDVYCLIVLMSVKFTTDCGGGEEASVDLRCSFVIEILLNISHENERAIKHSLLYMICSERSAFTVNLGEQKIYTHYIHIHRTVI